jgi:tetratricopeptide (TPR) repeat protein
MMSAMRAIVTLLALAFAMTAAHADENPWVKGTTPEQREAAQALLAQGNSLLLERNYVAALDTYRKAIASWDHPAIRFNIVRCLIQLDRPVEAVDELEKALQYGPAALEEGVYTEALSYQKLLANQIGRVALSCAQPGVAVTLDGQPLATCPSTLVQRVKPGRHQIVGERAGLETRTMRVVVVGGTEETVSLTLNAIGANARIVHRYAIWMPWTVLGSGALVVGIGALVEAVASNDKSDYEAAIQRTCASGCGGAELATIRNLESRARLEDRIALGIMGAGAATIVTGGILLFLNRGRTVYEPARVSVTATSSGGLVSLHTRF